MGNGRSANHTLDGFQYQFDKSILEILEAEPDNAVELEGIEDIDLRDQLVQCKYHSRQKFKPSSIKKPLSAFLRHFSSDDDGRTYVLYAHFKEQSEVDELCVADLKRIVGTELVSELELTDTHLKLFLSKRFRYERAKNLDDQHGEVERAILKSLDCSPEECRLFYYPNALHEVIRLSRGCSASGRQTTRREFTRTIDQKRYLFGHWLHQTQGKAAYISKTRKALNGRRALAPHRRKCVYVHKSVTDLDDVPSVVSFCENIVDSFYRLGKCMLNSSPVCIVVDQPKDAMQALKVELLRKGMVFNDGWEDLGFQSTLFNEPPVINRRSTRYGSSDIVVRSSYLLQLISSETFDSHFAAITAPDTFVVAGRLDSVSVQQPNNSSAYYLTEIDSFETLERILL